MMMKLPEKSRAESMLAQAEKSNPGRWVDHSRSTARNAQLIAERCAGLDPEAAYVLGLLHDIGRRVGICHMRHLWEGYRYLMDQGFDDAAAICMTHSFPLQDMRTFLGAQDVPQDAALFIQRFIETREYNDYDRLVQLCDAVSVPGGGVLMEKRMLDVAMRYGVNDLAPAKWEAMFALKRRFDALAGTDIYRLLPRIVENTLDW